MISSSAIGRHHDPRGAEDSASWDQRVRGLLGLAWFGVVWVYLSLCLAYTGATWSLGLDGVLEALGRGTHAHLDDYGLPRLAGFYASRVLAWQLSFTVLALAFGHGLRAVAPRLALPRRYALAGVLAASTLGYVHAAAPDGWAGALAPGFELETEYAPGYSEQAFREVEPGMLQEDVLERLGEPLHRDWADGRGLAHVGLFLDRGEECWHWSRSATDTHYRVRAVHFRDGVVTKVVAETFWD